MRSRKQTITLTTISNMKKPLLGIALIVAGFTLLAFCIGSLPEANANPSKLTRVWTSATTTESMATTTPNYMTPGRATTTLSVPIDGIDQVNLLIALKVSSTGSTLQWRYEYSVDGIDW